MHQPQKPKIIASKSSSLINFPSRISNGNLINLNAFLYKNKEIMCFCNDKFRLMDNKRIIFGYEYSKAVFN